MGSLCFGFKCSAAYQKLEKINIQNNEARILIAKAEVEAQKLVLNSIKMIKRFEKKYDAEQIEKWNKEGRLDSDESRMKAFKHYIEN